MAELQRKTQNRQNKNDQLTTADLANRGEEKPGAETETMETETPEKSGGPTLVRKENQRADAGVRDRASSAPPSEMAFAPLFSEAEITELRTRWSDVQSAFVDEPRKAVEGADQLVAAVMQHLAKGFANERSKLENQWSRGGDVSTEDLRVAMQRYRSFFDRLLNA